MKIGIMEDWNNGVMEEWNGGIMGRWKSGRGEKKKR